jgi:uncharacterized LabA/DUF88 family protein
MLDGGWVLKKLYLSLGKKHPEAADVFSFAHKCIESPEELFRIYFYNCLPSSEKRHHPISKKFIDFSLTDASRRGKTLFSNLAPLEYIAFRKGTLKFEGWGLTEAAVQEFIKGSLRTWGPEDIQPIFKQKEIDMKIGLDVAWLASKRIVERIILVTGDTDFIPAMKFARREGVQVVYVPLGGFVLPELAHHADFIRPVKFP